MLFEIYNYKSVYKKIYNIFIMYLKLILIKRIIIFNESYNSSYYLFLYYIQINIVSFLFSLTNTTYLEFFII